MSNKSQSTSWKFHLSVIDLETYPDAQLTKLYGGKKTFDFHCVTYEQKTQSIWHICAL